MKCNIVKREQNIKKFIKKYEKKIEYGNSKTDKIIQKTEQKFYVKGMRITRNKIEQ